MNAHGVGTGNRTPFGAALDRLINGLSTGAPTADLVAACETTLSLLPVTTLADAARVLDVEVAALESEGVGRIWRIAVLDSVRLLLSDLAHTGRSTAPSPMPDDRALLLLERDWLALTAQIERGAGVTPATANALWTALLAVADAPANGPIGILVKLRVLMHVLSDTPAGASETPEHRLLASTLAAVARLAAGIVTAGEAHQGAAADSLFIAAGHVLAPLQPPPALVEAGSRATGLSARTIRLAYMAMLRLVAGQGA